MMLKIIEKHFVDNNVLHLFFNEIIPVYIKILLKD